ncbi:MAG: iron complex outermembrane receptor protein [Candidatus Pelagisphaera sp.]|jgi:iron complex outermembrane receptor protein
MGRSAAIHYANMMNYKKEPILATLATVLAVGTGGNLAQAQSGDVIELEKLEVAASYSESLVASLETRREASNLQETIFAEDLGKFPDLNLAEALQRIPGIAIQRDNGEGNRIQLRGLGSNFVRVLLNGVPLSTADSGREVDFDIFPSELFTRITVDKTAQASHVEGGISGTINLRNARPFDFAGAGMTISTSLQLGYNSLAEEIDPRGHFLVSQTFDDGKWGFLAGLAFSERTLRVDAQETLDWGAAGFGGVIRGYNFDPDGDGIPVNQSGLPSTLHQDWVDQGERRSIGVVRADPTVDLEAPGSLERVRLPRLQRNDLKAGYRDRMGYVIASQFRPNERLLFNFDFFTTELDEFQERHELDIELRNQSDLVPINFVEVSPNDTLLRGTIGNADRRSESREIGFNDKFEQFSTSAEWQMNDDLKIDASLAMNNSKFRRDQQTYLYEIKDSEVTVDYTVGIIPTIASSVDILDPNSYNNSIANVDGSGNYTTDGSGTDVPTISLVRNAIDIEEEENLSLHLDATYGDALNNFKLGFAFDEFERTELDRDKSYNAASSNELWDTFSSGKVITASQGLKRLSDVAPNFGAIIGSPEGSVTDHMIADFAAHDAFFAGGNRAVLESAVAGPNDTPRVEESNMGFYGEANGFAEIVGRTLRVNAGIRVINTNQTSQNKTPAGAEIFVKRNYTNVLPSFNLAYDVHDDWVLRMSGAQAMTRPSIGQLQADTNFSSDFTANSSNPNLNPYLSDQIDLTAEWYYQEDSMVALNLFKKQLTGFLERQTTTIPFNQTGININDLDPNIFIDLTPDTLITNSTTVNSDELREIEGLEFVLQHPLDFIVDGLGFYGNYSLINSSDVILRSGAVEVVTAIQGLSPNLFNLVLYYESDRFSIRGSYNWRDAFTTSTGLNGTQPDLRTRDAVGQYDLSAQIPLPGFDDLQLTFEAINLTNSKEFEYFGIPERNRRYAGTGRQYFIGMRGTF